MLSAPSCSHCWQMWFSFFLDAHFHVVVFVSVHHPMANHWSPSDNDLVANYFELVTASQARAKREPRCSKAIHGQLEPRCGRETPKTVPSVLSRFLVQLRSCVSGVRVG